MEIVKKLFVSSNRIFKKNYLFHQINFYKKYLFARVLRVKLFTFLLSRAQLETFLGSSEETTDSEAGSVISGGCRRRAAHAQNKKDAAANSDISDSGGKRTVT